MGTCGEMVVGTKEGNAVQQVITLVTGAMIHHISLNYHNSFNSEPKIMILEPLQSL